jgi:hypothetical protein
VRVVSADLVRVRATRRFSGEFTEWNCEIGAPHSLVRAA